MPAKADALERWIHRYLDEEQPRSKSLIVTVFGDALAPHHDGAWLADLIALMAPFQMNERLVRTSVFRLTEEGWMAPTRDGRRSRYALTEAGQRRFVHSYRRIYTPPPKDWDGLWTVVVLARGDHGAPDRVGLKRELDWEGFGALAPGILIHPAADLGALAEVLAQLELSQRAVVMHAHDVPDRDFRSIADLVAQCWNLDEVAAGYRSFLERFQPLSGLLGPSLRHDQAFIVQTLLIHSFRRMTLHDPRLPAALLPADWPGHAAYELCRALYGRLQDAARSHLRAKLEPAITDPRPSAAFAARFGGIATN